jgi:hypothetical protein
MEKLAIKRLENTVYCRLGVSTVHGVGIFAIKEIPKGVNPFADSYIGQDAVLIHKNKIKNENISKLLEDYFPTNGNENCIIPLFPNQPIWTNYLNYTSDPEKVNIFLDSTGVWKTTKTIPLGEELLEDPQDHFINGDFKVRYVDRLKNDYLNLRK